MQIFCKKRRYAIVSDTCHKKYERVIWTVNLALTIIIVTSAVLGAIYAKKTFNETKDQVRLAKKTYFADQRPWIVLSSINPSSDNGKFSFTLVFKNSGKTPSIGLYIGAKTVPSAQWKAAADTFCEEGKKRASRPESQDDYLLLASIPQSNFEVSDNGDIHVSFDEADGISDPHIAGCIVYGDRIEGEKKDAPHETKFVARLIIKDHVVSVDRILISHPD
ncbi:hypothetical protein [Lichenihabitans psoromatis]|uniref:hypothetical protein n=1 Tax=Lichenihabitans psoromatis TaxID=2528642 RepID=UPI0010384967|nr:hypothetical protein [Lichenihabitans psoromatis]